MSRAALALEVNYNRLIISLSAGTSVCVCFFFYYVSLLGRHETFVKGIRATFEECRKRGEQEGQPAAEDKQQRGDERSSVRDPDFN